MDVLSSKQHRAASSVAFILRLAIVQCVEVVLVSCNSCFLPKFHANFGVTHEDTCRYRTPNLTDIDHQGLHPDESCSPLGISTGPGAVPMTEDAVEGMGSRLAMDSCVLTAESFLDRQLGISTVTTDEHEQLSKTMLVGKEQTVGDKDYTLQVHS